jgi:iron complex transport system substrate-binding protein
VVLAFSAWPAVSALTQSRFVDDAGRAVTMQPRVTRVFAAAGPAEVLLHTLAPEMLVGRNRVPAGAALEFFPPAYRKPLLIRRLPELNDATGDAELRALQPDLYVDYGTVDKDYIAVVNAVQQRTGIPGIILDGALERIPETYRRLGTAMGVRERGEHLGASAQRILEKYRKSLSANGSAPRVYLACSGDVVVPCYSDERGGEVLAWLGGINVAGSSASAPMRPMTIAEIRTLDPDLLIVHGAAEGAARLRSNPEWKAVPAVAQGRVFGWPDLPYSWGSRPPSVNRLAGLIWLAAVASNRSPNAVSDDIRVFFEEFYHVRLTDTQLQTLLGS